MPAQTNKTLTTAKKVTCPSCRTKVNPIDLVSYKGEKMCEGCAQSISDSEY